ncbi:hypothetical protein ABZ915_34655 [Streptomyces sp. NPDC046915]|uniref:hypothetical protein n=1 Tax=Streptomyces sp. NPDC046915 TaxID=3155257 RepID=UPI003408266D
MIRSCARSLRAARGCPTVGFNEAVLSGSLADFSEETGEAPSGRLTVRLKRVCTDLTPDDVAQLDAAGGE